MNNFVNNIINSKIYTKNEAILNVPTEPGAYAWFFKDIPPKVPVEECFAREGLTLLYIGISPSKPPISGKKQSSQNLRKRILNHYNGNASGSTLRLTLGCLLSEKLDLTLRRVGSNKRMTFTRHGEDLLSKWMETNAFVSWMELDSPWEIEKTAIEELSLPLNLAINQGHPFHDELSQIRSAARENAKVLPIVRI